MGREKIAVRVARVPCAGIRRATAQHHLIDHELTVVLASDTAPGFVSGVRVVVAARPLPDRAK